MNQMENNVHKHNKQKDISGGFKSFVIVHPRHKDGLLTTHEVKKAVHA